MSIQQLLQDFGYPAILIVLLLDSSGVPWPTEATLVLVGVALRAGHLHPGIVFPLALGGAAVGSILSYVLGRRMGPGLMQRIARIFRLSPATMDKVEEWFDKHGEKAVFFGRFIPFVRNLAGYPAGVMQIPFAKYLALSLAGYAGYIAFALFLGYGGSSIAHLIGDLEILLWLLAPLALLVIWFKWGRKRVRKTQGGKG